MSDEKRLFIEPYTIYKASGVISIKPIMPKLNEKGTALDAGGYMIEMAKSFQDQQRKYDWNNGVKFYISAAEAMKFVAHLKKADENDKIYHDPDKGRTGEGTRAKTLTIGTYEGKQYIEIYQTQAKLRNKVFIDATEADTIETLIRGTLPKIFGW